LTKTKWAEDTAYKVYTGLLSQLGNGIVRDDGSFQESSTVFRRKEGFVEDGHQVAFKTP
jgi:hypothetical protein